MGDETNLSNSAIACGGYRRALGLFVAIVGASLPCRKANAGFVFFAPSDVVIDRMLHPPGHLDLSLSLQTFFLPSVDSLSVLVGSDRVPFVSFLADPQTEAVFGGCPECPFVEFPGVRGVYTSELFIGGNAGTGTPAGSAFPLGVLRIDLTSLENGDYRVVVDSAFDGNASRVGLEQFTEPLLGVAQIRIVPEPRSIVLWGFAGLVWAGGRRYLRPLSSRRSCD